MNMSFLVLLLTLELFNLCLSVSVSLSLCYPAVLLVPKFMIFTKELFPCKTLFLDDFISHQLELVPTNDSQIYIAEITDPPFQGLNSDLHLIIHQIPEYVQN